MDKRKLDEALALTRRLEALLDELGFDALSLVIKTKEALLEAGAEDEDTN